MRQESKIGIKVALEAGKLLLQNFNSLHQVHYKGTINPVTEMDQQSEHFIAQELSKAFPSYGFIGEEGCQSKGLSNLRWIVDPLDGTTNYAHGYPLFAVSIALVQRNEVLIGVVYCPILRELFYAEQDNGAFMNGQPIQVSRTKDIGRSLVGTGFPYDAWTNTRDNTTELRRFTKNVISVRSDGAAAIDLCHVAIGRLDAYWDLELESWDMAAGALIVTEAGGKVTTISGSRFNLGERNIVASNGFIHTNMLTLLDSKTDANHSAFKRIK
jgi:myo-inositol-1(or 4)-monophosphatase